MTKAEREMLEEVALRNAMSKFRKINLATGRKAATPKVGIFWVDDRGRMFMDGVSPRDAEDYGEFRIYDKGHFDVWGDAVRENPKWEGVEYGQIPRGMVVYHKDPKRPEFVVYMPRQIAKHKDKVMSAFGLPVGHVRFDYSDEHYRMSGK